MHAQAEGMWDTVLFRADLPFTTVSASMADIQSLNNLLAGTPPRLDEKQIEAMIDRDWLTLPGLEQRIS